MVKSSPCSFFLLESWKFAVNLKGKNSRIITFTSQEEIQILFKINVCYFIQERSDFLSPPSETLKKCTPVFVLFSQLALYLSGLKP